MTDQHGRGRPTTGPRWAAAVSRFGERLPGPPWLVWVLLVVVVLAVVVGVVLALTGSEDDEQAAPAPTVTVTAAEPTPAVEPVDRGEGSALLGALPGTVRQYALAEVAPSEAFAASDVLESYALTYVGPDAVASFSVLVGQWATAPEAAASAALLLEAAGTPTSTGDVLVEDQTVGTYSVVDHGDGTATVVWTNGTLALQATGPVEDAENVYRAYTF